MPLAVLLVAGTITWPIMLGLALVDRIDEPPGTTSALVYAAASRVCHQRAERSFVTAGQQWPVCARCAGLYLSAPVGAIAAGLARLRGRRILGAVVAVSAVPTVVSWFFEAVGGVGVSGLLRLVCALPLGAALAFAMVTLARSGNRIG